MKELIAKAQELLPEYIESEYPKKADWDKPTKRGMATVEIVKFLLWLRDK